MQLRIFRPARILADIHTVENSQLQDAAIHSTWLYALSASAAGRSLEAEPSGTPTDPVTIPSPSRLMTRNKI